MSVGIIRRICRRGVDGESAHYVVADVYKPVRGTGRDCDGISRVHAHFFTADFRLERAVEHDEGLVAVGMGVHVVAAGFFGREFHHGALAARCGFENFKTGIV